MPLLLFCALKICAIGVLRPVETELCNGILLCCSSSDTLEKEIDKHLPYYYVGKTEKKQRLLIRLN